MVFAVVLERGSAERTNSPLVDAAGLFGVADSVGGDVVGGPALVAASISAVNFAVSVFSDAGGFEEGGAFDAFQAISLGIVVDALGIFPEAFSLDKLVPTLTNIAVFGVVLVAEGNDAVLALDLEGEGAGVAPELGVVVAPGDHTGSLIVNEGAFAVLADSVVVNAPGHSLDAGFPLAGEDIASGALHAVLVQALSAVSSAVGVAGHAFTIFGES